MLQYACECVVSVRTAFCRGHDLQARPDMQPSQTIVSVIIHRSGGLRQHLQRVFFIMVVDTVGLCVCALKHHIISIVP